MNVMIYSIREIIQDSNRKYYVIIRLILNNFIYILNLIYRYTVCPEFEVQARNPERRRSKKKTAASLVLQLESGKPPPESTHISGSYSVSPMLIPEFATPCIY